jgi:hypothetical protein
VDPRSAPQWVLLALSSDEIAQLMLDSGPSWPTLGFPAPVDPEPCPMPPQDGGRLHNSSQSQQTWPEPRHPDHQGPVTPPQPQTLRRSSQDNVELMTQKEVLNFKPAPRLEQIADKCSKQVDDRKHRIG